MSTLNQPGYPHITKKPPISIRGYNEMDLEIESLRRKLRAAQFALAQTQNKMELHKIRTRQLITSWKLKIHEAEARLQRQRKERDIELKEITSQLLFFEGQLRKEQSDIKSMLKKKDRIISQQQQKIRELEKRNEELHQALRDAKKRVPNGLHVSFSTEEPASFSGDNSLTDDVFLDSLRSPSNESKHPSSSSGGRQILKNKNEEMSNSKMNKSHSLPNFHEADLGMAHPHTRTVGFTNSPAVQPKRQKVKPFSTVRSASKDTYDVSHIQDKILPGKNSISKTNDGYRNYLTSSHPNLHSETLDESSKSKNSAADHLDSYPVSLKIGELSRVKSQSHDQIIASDIKSESTRDRLKRAVLRPRDIKKKSKLRLRTNSLKENESNGGDDKRSGGDHKRFFSFTF